MITLGIDVGGSSVKVAALRSGSTVWTGQSGRYSRPDRDAVVRAMRDAVAGRVADVTGVGLCVPGIMDERRERVTFAVNVPGLVGIPLAELASDAMRRRVEGVTVANDSNATAWDLYTARKLTGRLLTIVMGTGVGASVLDERGFLDVDGDSPGHLGQVDVSLEPNPALGPDGGAGGLEAYVGADALARRYGVTSGGIDFERIGPDDPAVRALARAIRICHAIYRPLHVCLAGGTGIRLGRRIEPLRALVDVHLTSVARPDWTLSVGENDFHAAAGAAKLAAMER